MKKSQTRDQIKLDDMLIQNPFSTREIYSGKLICTQGYQKPINQMRVKYLISHFNPELFSDIIVSFRDGRYYVIDGQHRLVVALTMNGGKDLLLRCKVITGLTYKEEAQLFCDLNSCQPHLNAIDNIRGKIEAGDKESTEINKVLHANGLKWDSSTANGHVKSVVEVRSAYRNLGFEDFSRMVRLMKETWNGNHDSLSQFFFAGLSLFFKTYPEVSDEAFLHSMQKFPAAQIIRDGHADISTNNLALKYGRVFLSCYNKHQRKKLPYRYEG